MNLVPSKQKTKKLASTQTPLCHLLILFNQTYNAPCLGRTSLQPITTYSHFMTLEQTRKKHSVPLCFFILKDSKMAG